MTPQIGDRITRIEQGERVIYRVTEVDESSRTYLMEPISIAGYMAIGLAIQATYHRRKDGGP